MAYLTDVVNRTKQGLASYPVGTMAIAAASGVLAGLLIQRQRRRSAAKRFDKSFTGAYPRNSGAKSAVTGGSPEDMNGMPATPDPLIEGPIYDGSHL